MAKERRTKTRCLESQLDDLIDQQACLQETACRLLNEIRITRERELARDRQRNFRGRQRACPCPNCGR